MAKAGREWQSIFQTVEEKENFKKEWDTLRAGILFNDVSRETLSVALLQIRDIVHTSKCHVPDNECLYPSLSECMTCKINYINNIICEVVGNGKETDKEDNTSSI